MTLSAVDIVREAIDAGGILARVADPSAGGSVLFVGTTRTPSHDRAVEYLEYEAYRPMALKQMAAIVEAAGARWPLVRVCAIHRVGRVEVGEASVVIAVSAVHRAAAFEACRYVIDAVKKDVPIWKKEVFAGGHEWVGP